MAKKLCRHLGNSDISENEPKPKWNPEDRMFINDGIPLGKQTFPRIMPRRRRPQQHLDMRLAAFWTTHWLYSHFWGDNDTLLISKKLPWWTSVTKNVHRSGTTARFQQKSQRHRGRECDSQHACTTIWYRLFIDIISLLPAGDVRNKLQKAKLW